MASGRSRLVPRERDSLDPFEALAGEIPPRDQRDLMERPFFSLAKTRRTAPILYRAGETEVQVHAVPEHGLATIWDADVLIWAASHLVEALDRGLPTSRFFRFTPYQLLGAIRRGRGRREYVLLKGALARLQSTVIRTTIRQGEHWRRQQFSWISEWEELVTWSGRVEGMEFVLPDWFYQGVLDRRLVLTINPAYFALTGGFSDSAPATRRIVARQPLPGYALALERDARGQQLLHMRPVQTLWTSGGGIGTSGASDIGTSGAPATGHQAHGSSHSRSASAACAARNSSNSESNSSVAAGAVDDATAGSAGKKGRR